MQTTRTPSPPDAPPSALAPSLRGSIVMPVRCVGTTKEQPRHGNMRCETCHLVGGCSAEGCLGGPRAPLRLDSRCGGGGSSSNNNIRINPQTCDPDQPGPATSPHETCDRDHPSQSSPSQLSNVQAFAHRLFAESPRPLHHPTALMAGLARPTCPMCGPTRSMAVVG